MSLLSSARDIDYCFVIVINTKKKKPKVHSPNRVKSYPSVCMLGGYSGSVVTCPFINVRAVSWANSSRVRRRVRTPILKVYAYFKLIYIYICMMDREEKKILKNKY